MQCTQDGRGHRFYAFPPGANRLYLAGMLGTVALIVAGGRGSRAGTSSGTAPKQYARMGGTTVLRRAVEAFARHPEITSVRVVIREQDRDLYQHAIDGLAVGLPIFGADTRQGSVRNGLEAIAADSPERVLIHDAARPFVSEALISRVLAALETSDAAAPVLPVADTLRSKSSTGYELVSRENLFRMQTPQGFRFIDILGAHRRFAAEEATDDVALAERAGLSFSAVAGEESNMKLTTPEDLRFGEALAGAGYETRSGTGFDVHRFAPGDHVWLCGVNVAHEFGLEGHPDADVGLHALTDAILGAAGAGDIGMHFPPTDERWRGAASHLFLAHAASLVRESAGEILHVDVTLICERPKVGPHRDAMRRRIAEILGLSETRVSVKATTTEGLGFTGRGEGIAAQAIATLRVPA